MKYILFIVAALGTSLNAFALYSPKDCQEALKSQVWNNREFTPVRRLDGALDGSTRATLLVRLPRPDQTVAVPDGSGLKVYPEQTFTAGKKDFGLIRRRGHTYGLIHGEAQALIANRRALAKLNGGRRVAYQVLDQDQVTIERPRLGVELARRAPILRQVKRPFVALDRWFERFVSYRRLKNALDRFTNSVRGGAAVLLHDWRNPPVEVSAFLRREVRECVGDCAVQTQWGDQVQITVAEFSKLIGSGFKLNEAGSLEGLTLELMTLANPAGVLEHEALVRQSDLGDWNPGEQTRFQRLVKLEHAWDLVERATWGQAEAGPLTVVRLMRTMQEIYDNLQAPVPARQVSLAEFTQGLVDGELFEARYEVLRQRRPYVVIADDHDTRLVAMDARWFYSQSYADLARDVEAVAGRPLSAGARAVLQGRTTRDAPQERAFASTHTMRGLRDLAEMQTVAIVKDPVDTSSIVLVPLTLDPEYHVDTAVLSAVKTPLKPLQDFVTAHREEARRLSDGQRELTYTDDAGEVRRVRFTERLALYRRDEVTLTAARRLVVDYAPDVRASGMGPFDQVNDLITRNLDVALRQDDGTRRLTFTDEAGRDWRFDFTVETDDATDHVTVTGVREVKEKAATAFWKALAEQNGVAEIDFNLDGKAYPYGLDNVTHLAMSPQAAAKVLVNRGLRPDELMRVLTKSAGAPIDLATRCASADGFEVCFGPMGGSFGRVVDVRPVADTASAEVQE